MMIRTTFISGAPPHPAPPVRAAPAIPAPAILRKCRLVRVFFTSPSPGRIQGAIIFINRPPGHAGNPLPCDNARRGNYRDGGTGPLEDGGVAEAVWWITTRTGSHYGATSSTSST